MLRLSCRSPCCPLCGGGGMLYWILMKNCLGHTLLIVNPASKVGKGAAAGERARRLLETACVDITCYCTERPGHAVELASSAAAYDTVIALGGDGVIHEVANGLLALDRHSRPVLGVIPVGSGNDYARTLGMSEKVETACAQLLSGEVRSVDAGLCNGRFFVETLSFGIDAAIALDTVQRRKRTNKTGNALYFEAGLNQLIFHRDMHRYRACFDDDAPEQGESLTFAVQIGCTYGGGFRICPQASPADGLFDVCIAHPPIGLIGAVSLFAKAKEGRHVGSPQIEIRQAARLSVRFEHDVPAQMDGEDCTGNSFEVAIAPGALSVLFGSKL